MQAFKQQTNEAHIALNTLYSLFLLQTHFPDVHVHFHSKEKKNKLKWGKSAEKWNSLMVVTIKVTITKLTKKLFCINYFQKYIYSATKFIFSPLFSPPFNLCYHRHPFTQAQTNTLHHMLTQTHICFCCKQNKSSSYRNCRTASITFLWHKTCTLYKHNH